MKKSPAKKSGFTLIEIVIVLAIAALIMVIVFVAVQGAQRSRRDTDRRAAASRVLTSLVSCASDNSGKIGDTVTCATYISGATTGSAYTGSGDLKTSATQPSNDNKNTITGGVTALPATACPAAWATQAALVSGQICAYYWSEASGSVVVLSSSL